MHCVCCAIGRQQERCSCNHNRNQRNRGPRHVATVIQPQDKRNDMAANFVPWASSEIFWSWWGALGPSGHSLDRESECGLRHTHESLSVGCGAHGQREPLGLTWTCQRVLSIRCLETTNCARLYPNNDWIKEMNAKKKRLRSERRIYFTWLFSVSRLFVSFASSFESSFTLPDAEL